jgi:hypothetical protein
MTDETATSERITCYIAVGDAGGGWMWNYPAQPDTPAVLAVRCVYFLVNTATGRTVRYYLGRDLNPPKPQNFNYGTWQYTGPFELAGGVRLAIGAEIQDFYRSVYPDMVCIWYP